MFIHKLSKLHIIVAPAKDWNNQIIMWLVYLIHDSMTDSFNSTPVCPHVGGTPGAYCIKLLTGENSGYFLPEFFPVLKSMAESC